MMAWNAAVHPDELVCDLLAKRFAELCYDGKPFFAPDHPVEDGDGVVSSVSNMQTGSGDARSPLDTSRPIKPLAFQTRVPCTCRQLDRDRGNHVVFRDAHAYGIRARVNAGFALWQLAFGSRDTLDVTNCALARAAIVAASRPGLARALPLDFDHPLDRGEGRGSGGGLDHRAGRARIASGAGR